jgi:hypothetical protein
MTMQFELTEWGGRFPDRPYYPMYLGNGVDALLINVMGSGDYNGEYLDDDMGACYTYLRNLGWYKSDRRTHTGTRLVYGTLFPHLEFAADCLINGDAMVPRSVRQYFSPTRATLTTFFEQLDHDTLEWLKVRVTTFLTAGHVLVEHYDVLEAPASGTGFVFILSSPLHPYCDYYKPLMRMDRLELNARAGESLIEYRYAFEGFHGAAFSWFDLPCAAAREIRDAEQGTAIGKTTTTSLRRGQSVTRYLAVVDNEDAADVEAEWRRLLAECRALGYEALKARHQEDWAGYFGASRVRIPDPAVQHVYELGRYLIRAVQHPRSGFTPIGNLPHLWQGVMFWDSSFALEALLGCGNSAEANRMIAHLQRLMPLARDCARRQGARGARLEWTVTSRAFTDYGGPTAQFHNNAVWARAAFLCYAYTGDRAVLAGHVGLMEDYLLFMVDHCLTENGPALVVGSCQGVDESVSNKKTNDTWTNAVTLKALMLYRDALGILDRPSAIPDLDRVIDRLQLGLEQNVDAGGVLQSFAGGRLPNFGSLIFHLFPAHRALRPTLLKMMENHDPEMGLYNFHGVNRYAEKMFPWANFWAARLWSQAGDPNAGMLLKNALKAVNYFGALPERIYYHGELYNNWLTTAHSAMIWALNGILAHAEGEILRLLSGAEPAWKDADFAGLHAGEGLVVSAAIRNGALQKLEIENRSDRTRRIALLVGEDPAPRELTLAPGRNVFRS